LLILSTYEKVLWQVEATSGTTIKGIVVSSYGGDSGLIAPTSTAAYRASLPYAYETNNINFGTILSQLHALFGAAKIDVFYGKYSVSSLVAIRSLDGPRPELTLAGIQALTLTYKDGPGA
jgi:hypothetical protein